MPFARPTRYIIEYTDRKRWEELHRAPHAEPADPVDFRAFADAKTLIAARKEAARLLAEWEFAQPVIYRRDPITPVAWDYGLVSVDDDE